MLDLIPTLFSWVDITAAMLLPFIAILAAIPSTRRYGGKGVLLISYFFAAFVLAGSAVVIYYYFQSKVLPIAALILGIGAPSPINNPHHHMKLDLVSLVESAALSFIFRRISAYVIAWADKRAG